MQEKKEEEHRKKRSEDYQRNKKYYINYRGTHREEYNRRNREYKKRLRIRDPEGVKERQRRNALAYRIRVRMDVLNRYGNGKIGCVKCGESRLACLSIDHIQGGGIKHRRELATKGGTLFYQWLRLNNYPAGYQVLCMNCQWVKRVEEKEV